MNQGAECITTTCSMCKIVLPDQVFKAVLSQAQYERYQMFLYKSYVDISKYANWCSGQNCEMIAELKPNVEVKIFDATCSECLDVFCFGCGLTGHQPVNCEKIKIWESRTGKKDEGNESWIALNTKTCPTCSKIVEKDGGCMYVLCKCGNEFCWLCLQKTKNHRHFEKCDVEKMKENLDQGTKDALTDAMRN